MTYHLDQDASPAITGRPRRQRAAALLGTTALLTYAAPLATAVFTLSPASLAVAVPVPVSSRAPHAGAAFCARAKHQATVQVGALGVDKYPREAGD